MYHTVSSNAFAQTLLNQLSFWCFRYVFNHFDRSLRKIASNTCRVKLFFFFTFSISYFYFHCFFFDALLWVCIFGVLKQIKVSLVAHVCLFVSVSINSLAMSVRTADHSSEMHMIFLNFETVYSFVFHGKFCSNTIDVPTISIAFWTQYGDSIT